jgi:uncharacterized protein involved in outer membrane biogenesis
VQTVLLSLATAVILAIVAAFAAPAYIDWTQWRATFETQAARAVGAPVVIRGPITAELLPIPKLVLHDVSIGADGVGTGVTAAELRGSFALGSLLKGELAADHLTVVKPKVRLVLDATGKIALPTGARTPGGFSIGDFVIESGALDVLDRSSGRSFTLSDVDLKGEIGSATGPVKLDGEIESDGHRQIVKLLLGVPAADGSAKLRVVLGGTNAPSGFEADGALRLAGGQPAFEGRSSYTVKPVKDAATPLARAGWSLAGTVRATRESVEAQDLTLSLGTGDRPVELTGTGKLAAVPGAPVQARAPMRLDLALGARQIDLNAMTAGAGPLAALADIAQALAPLAELTATGNLALSSDTVLIGGAPVRELKADLGWSGNGWQVKTFAAKLPGRSAVQVTGRVPRGAADSLFAGDLAIDAEDLPTLAGWASPNAATPLAGLPPGAASLKGAIAAGPARVRLDNLVLGLGTLRLTGAAGYAYPDAGGRGKLDATLKGDGVDLDALLPLARRLLASGRDALDVALAFDGTNVRLSGLPAAKLGLTLAASNGGLSIDRLDIGNLGGLDVAGRGRLASADQLDGGFEARLTGAKADGLTVLAQTFGPAGLDALTTRLGPVLTPVDLTLKLAAGNGRSDITASGRLGGLSGTAAFGFGGGEQSGKLTLDIADGADVLGRFGVPGLRPKLGPARLDATVAPKLDAQLLLAGANLTARGDLTKDTGGDWRPTLQVSLATADLAKLFPVVAAAADGTGAVPVNLAGTLTRPEATWRIDGLAGTLSGGKIEGSLGYGPDRPEPVEADIRLDRWSLGRALALVAGRAGGNGAWPDGRFGPPPLPDLAATVSLTVGRLDMPVGLPLADARLRARLAPGSAAIEDLSGRFAGGMLSGTLKLARRGEVLAADGHLALTGADLTTLLTMVSAKPALDGKVTIGLDLAGSGRTPALLAQSLAGQGSLAIDDFELNGADPRSLQYVMLATERGAPPDGRKLAQLVADALSRGPLDLPRVDASLSVLNGVAKTGTARVALGTQRFALDGSLDLARLAIDASVEMEDAADPRATAPPSVTVQWRGPIANPDRRLDAAALGAAINMRALERETKRLEAEYGRSPVMDAGHSTDAPDGSSAAPQAPGAPAAAVPAPMAPAVTPPVAAPPVAAPAQLPAVAPMPTPAPGPPPPAVAADPAPARPAVSPPPATPPKPRRARVLPPPATREPVDQPDFGGPDLMLPPLPPPITIGPDRPLRPPATVPQ